MSLVCGLVRPLGGGFEPDSCYNAQSAHLLQVLGFILLFMTMQEGVEGIRGE